MVIGSFPAGALAANCYVLAAAPDGPCVVIDPGMDAMAGLQRVLRQDRLTPAAVLLTHGHFDHVADAAEIADRYDAGCWIGPADRRWLADPLAALTPDFHPLVTQYADPAAAAEPARMLTAVSDSGNGRLEIAGLTFELIPAPGHTPGSTLLRTVDPEENRELIFTGDVLFAGTVGRTDLPAGDPAAMERTLSSTVLSLADDAVVLPGHGPQTTIGRERVGNPFLVGLDQH
ncbi:MAG TPA: MBL fold metallo-hydrolase [Microlunatus sp.]